MSINQSIAQMADQNSNWKGDFASYSAIHFWINNHKPKPALCERCQKELPHDCANISGEYRRDVNDYEWLCRRCHMKEDGRLQKLKETGARRLDKWRKNQTHSDFVKYGKLSVAGAMRDGNGRFVKRSMPQTGVQPPQLKGRKTSKSKKEV